MIILISFLNFRGRQNSHKNPPPLLALLQNYKETLNYNHRHRLPLNIPAPRGRNYQKNRGAGARQSGEPWRESQTAGIRFTFLIY